MFNFRIDDKVMVIGRSHFKGRMGVVKTVGSLSCCVILDGDNVSTPFCYNELEMDIASEGKVSSEDCLSIKAFLHTWDAELDKTSPNVLNLPTLSDWYTTLSKKEKQTIKRETYRAIKEVIHKFRREDLGLDEL